ncbi:phospho-N-acetylmuramoyl-pentapeptide-transferase [Porphyromonas endodontalis]
MIYYLADLMQDWQLSGARLLHYVSFRAVLAFVFSLLIATLVGSKIIDKLRQKQIGETIRELGLEGEQSKKNTPTMGGIIIIISILIPALLFARLDNIYIILMLITTVMMGLLGFIDDYIKVFKHNKKGLSGKYKLVWQALFGLVLGLVLYLSPETSIRENREVRHEGKITNVTYSNVETKSTKTTIPFVKNNNFDYADLLPVKAEHKEVVGWILFIVVATLIVTFISNCVNLTDGLDGLAAGSSAPVGVVLLIFAYVSSHINMASYLNIMYISGAEELVIFAAAFVGATIGFLWYNANPAQVFMGDTGSLTLGGIIAVFAILVRKELLLPILCGLFVVEGLSVMIQTAYYKHTKHKAGGPVRIFRMAPLHHHFQKAVQNVDTRVLIDVPKKLVKENKLVVRFWIIALLLAAFSLATLKMR